MTGQSLEDLVDLDWTEIATYDKALADLDREERERRE